MQHHMPRGTTCHCEQRSDEAIALAVKQSPLAGQATEARVSYERIEINPDIMGGKPVIRGTRVPVETILRKLGAGMTHDAIIADHPRLTQDDILAAQAFAADYLADEALVYG